MPSRHPIRIGRDPDTVWAFVTDFDRCPEWVPGQLEKRLVSESAPRQGSRVHVKQQVPGGRVVENTIEIAAFEPPRRISERSVGGSLDVRVDYLLESAGDGATDVTIEYDVRGRGLAVMVGFVVRRSMERQMPTTLDNLKQLVEALPS